MVRYSIYSSTLARPSDQGNQLASELHATLYKVCGTYTAHDLAFRFGGGGPTARCGVPHDACLVPALSLGSSRSCATPKHGARSIASPRLIARCRRARCRSTASEAGAGTSLAMFLRSIFHGRSYLQRRRKTVRSAGLRCSQRSHPSSSGAAIGVLAHATSGSDFM